MIVFFDQAARWAFVVGLALGAGLGSLYGRWEAYFQLRWARVAWHEVRRYRRLRRLRRG